ncbi:hypothetical protein [Microbacterium sp. cf332]|uniref:acyl-CoA-like ligand-binding transcription factor n=1 Tax=Microbacterium sp. cf332 TaxID=1761804 RepID=UPI0008904BFF|nr:hypothetical protein [Microbacterium sp. cf332]SDQ53695.1 hypothetical protein SAMN04487847_1762 [Microbacterium sp. cf332]
MFDITLEYVKDDRQRARNDSMEEIVRSTPQLYARYLEKMQRGQKLLIGRIAARIGSGESDDDPRAAAIVGAAFACVQAACETWFASEQFGAFEQALDEAMNILAVQTSL